MPRRQVANTPFCARDMPPAMPQFAALSLGEQGLDTIMKKTQAKAKDPEPLPPVVTAALD